MNKKIRWIGMWAALLFVYAGVVACPNRYKRLELANRYVRLSQRSMAQLETQQAVGHYEKALQIRKEINGDMHPSLAPSYFQMGMLYTFEGDSPGAGNIPIMHPYQRKPGDDRDLGIKYYQKAINCFQRALDLRRNDSDPAKYPKVPTIYYHLGDAYCAIGEFDQAVVNHQKAVAIGEQYFGKDHSDSKKFIKALNSALKKRNKTITIKNE
jgi:tetratricopeptide (TPR) repeat protein